MELSAANFTSCSSLLLLIWIFFVFRNRRVLRCTYRSNLILCVHAGALMALLRWHSSSWRPFVLAFDRKLLVVSRRTCVPRVPLAKATVKFETVSPRRAGVASEVASPARHHHHVNSTPQPSRPPTVLANITTAVAAHNLSTTPVVQSKVSQRFQDTFAIFIFL